MIRYVIVLISTLDKSSNIGNVFRLYIQYDIIIILNITNNTAIQTYAIL